MSMAQEYVGACQGTARDPIAAEIYNSLRNHFPQRRADYVVSVLSARELSVVDDLADALHIARIKRMSGHRLARYDEFVPADDAALSRYRSIQLEWLKDEEYLLGTRLGRSPTPTEFCKDFMTNQHGLRFRAYFAMKYPDKMIRTTRRLTPTGTA